MGFAYDLPEGMKLLVPSGGIDLRRGSVTKTDGEHSAVLLIVNDDDQGSYAIPLTAQLAADVADGLMKFVQQMGEG